MSDEPIAPGQILAGKYAIERVLGQGTMGLVLGARHIALQQPVAIKIMLAGRKVTADHEARFLREARIAAMLKSEHAAKVLDMGTHESGAPYIVMEFLDGQDLAAVLEERGPLQVGDAVAYILQACEAIAEAHALGIVHRDIKPANLFLTKSMDGDCVKVVDFGVAKQMDSDLGLTGTGAALGSPLYMSPEQMNGSRDVDARADIWALGVTLYELLAQTTPFHADTVMALMTHVLLEPPRPLEQFRPDAPPGLAAVIVQALEKDRQRRFPSVAQFAAALAPYAGASSAQHVERAAKVQHVDVAPSRPTIELRAPSDAGLVEAASASPAMLTNASRGEAPANVEAAPRSPSSGRLLTRIAGVVAGGLLAGASLGGALRVIRAAHARAFERGCVAAPARYGTPSRRRRRRRATLNF